MNSEELELSLRAEFENYLKGYFSGLQKDMDEFRSKMEAEFEKQRASFSEALSGFAPNLEGEFEFNEAFRSSVSEHLRLARDEGAALTANAFAEAEKLREETAPVAASYDKILEAVKDISSHTSQSAILKALVAHASEFAPRGAFFITKSDHLVGWKVFPSDDESLEASIRQISLPISGDTVLGRAVRDLTTADAAFGEHSDDQQFLEPIGFGHPDRLYAIPLVARGRGVAVLYADYGNDGAALNSEALETLVRVAGLTVEVNAVAPAAAAPAVAAPETTPTFAPAVSDDQPAAESDSYSTSGSGAEYSYQGEQRSDPVEPAPEFSESTADEAASFESEPVPAEIDYSYQSPQDTEPTFAAPEYSESTSMGSTPVDAQRAFAEVEPAVEAAPEYEPVPVGAYDDAAIETSTGSGFEFTSGSSSYDNSSFDRGSSSSGFEYESGRADTQTFSEPASSGRDFDSYSNKETSTEGSIVYEQTIGEPVEMVEAEVVSDYASPFDQAVETGETGSVADVTGNDHQPSVETPSFEAPVEVESYSAPEPTPVPVAETPAPRARLSDRPVDLPIEVSDDERRLHNDARRFARLLVSEIKLYNEKKVTEGREASDLYDRLREAIDRSREMYDKRVQPPVAAKFDYFHYELVNSLADGDDNRLGSSYPGATV